MAAEDLKHLFVQVEKEESSESNDFELLDELSFATKDNTQSMTFENLPTDKGPSHPQNANTTEDNLVLKLISDRISNIEEKIKSTPNDFKVNTLVELRVADHKITNLLQRILSKSPQSKQEVMAIKKLLNELVKSIS